MIRRTPLWAIGILALGCTTAPPAAPPPAAPAEAYVLRVLRVEVRGLRPDSGDRWDVAEGPASANGGCDLLAVGGKLLAPIAGEAVKLLCGMAERPALLEKEPTNPDLQLRLSSEAGATYESYVVPDAVSYNFNYEFVVPTAAIATDGLLLEVLDADGQEQPEVIASTRLMRDRILGIANSPRPLADLASGAATRLELAVAPYSATRISRIQMEAQAAPQRAHDRRLMAGEVVSLAARGEYTIGSFYDQPIGPNGYPDGKLHSYNFEQQPFTTAAHACAIALVGDRGRVDGAVIGSQARFVVTAAGTLRVGINDRDPSNNRGWISFEGETRAPTAAEWANAIPGGN